MNACKKNSFPELFDLDGPGDSVVDCAVAGAWLGWLLGLCVGVGFLSLPEFGLALGRGSFLTALLVDALGTLLGGLVGALIGWTLRHHDTLPRRSTGTRRPRQKVSSPGF